MAKQEDVPVRSAGVVKGALETVNLAARTSLPFPSLSRESKSISSSVFSIVQLDIFLDGNRVNVDSPLPKGVKITSATVEDGQQVPIKNVDYDRYVAAFRRVVKTDLLEYGEVTKCDALVERWHKELGVNLAVVLNAIFLSCIGDKQVILFLLKAISHIPYEDVLPFAPVQVIAALSHNDVEVVEAGIRVFENWETKAGIVILEQVRTREDWLEEYRVSTIEYLKGI